MESLKSLEVLLVRGPCFATIEQHRNTDSLVDSYLGGDGKIVIEEQSMQQSAEGRRCSLSMYNILYNILTAVRLLLCM